MSNVKKELRADDTEIRKLNHLGLSLKAIGEHVGCHGVTVSVRLKEMGVEPSDTRRSFMDKVYAGLDPDEQEWLASGLYNKGMHVKDFVVALLKEAYRNRPVEQPVAPPELPALQPVIFSDEYLKAKEDMKTSGVPELSSLQPAGDEDNIITEVIPPSPFQQLMESPLGDALVHGHGLIKVNEEGKVEWVPHKDLFQDS